MSRPSKYTPERCAAILTAIRGGNTRIIAAKMAGISDSTLSDWMIRFPSFRDDIEKADAEAEGWHVLNVRQHAAETWQASAWWLERRRPKQWGRVDRVDVTFRRQAEAMAASIGCTVDELIEEAERIAATQWAE